MNDTLLRGAILAALLCCAPAAAPGQEGAGGAPSEPPPAGAGKLEVKDLLIPPDAVVIVVPDLKEAGKYFPSMTILRPEHFRDLQKQIEDLKRQLKPGRLRPSRCDLEGRVEGEFAVFQAEFPLATEKPNQVVSLGCQGAVPTEAHLDGELALLQNGGAEGFVVQVPGAGRHTLSMRLKVRVETQAGGTPAGGTGRAVTLGLPEVPSSLRLHLPARVEEVQVNDFVETAPKGRDGGTVWEADLGLARQLSLRWAEPPVVAPTGSSLQATWDVQVQVLEEEVVTTAALKLRELLGKPSRWHVYFPREMTVKDVKGAEGQIYMHQRDEQTGLVRVEGPAAQELTLVAERREKRPLARVSVGPLLVPGADRQNGEFRVYGTPEALRGQWLSFRRHGDLQEREPGGAKERADLVARFYSWDLTGGLKPAALKNPKSLAKLPPNLEVELKKLPALVETAVEHLVALRPNRDGSWQVTTISRVHATPFQNRLDYLDVELPGTVPEPLRALSAVLLAPWPGGVPAPAAWAGAGWAGQGWPVRGPAEFVCVGEGSAVSAELHRLPEPGRARVHLDQLQGKPFVVVLKAEYTVAAGHTQARVPLPRPLPLRDRGAKVTVDPADRLEVGVVDESSVPRVTRDGPLQLDWQRSPESVELTWKPYRPELPLRQSVDVTLRGRHARVRQELSRDPAGEPAPAGAAGGGPVVQAVRLSVPAGVLGYQVLGGAGETRGAGPGAVTVELAGEAPAVVEYDFALPPPEGSGGEGGPGREVEVPLLWPEQAARVVTRLRLWAEAGSAPRVTAGSEGNALWRDAELKPGDLAGKETFPAAVLEADRAGAPLTVALGESPLAPLAGVVADRALVQVTIDQEGNHVYRTRFRLTRLDGKDLDIEFPRPFADLMPEIVVEDGARRMRVVPAEVEVGGSVARVRLEDIADVTRPPVTLDVRFQVPVGRQNTLQLWQAFLQPPRLRGSVFVNQWRWQVRVQGNEVPVVLADRPHSPQTWEWRNWLFAPVSRVREGDLEAWVSDSPPPADRAEAGPPAGVVFWGTGEPVRVALVPRQVWLLVCSGLFLLAGLGLFFLSVGRLLWWLTFLAVAAGLVAAAVLWPALLPQLAHGVQPGLVVLLIIFLAQWLVHRRYRRQVVFLPSFARLQPGSSVRRAEPPAPPREPSTVDAVPPPRGSSLTRRPRVSDR